VKCAEPRKARKRGNWRNVERAPSEWIMVPVPPIVTGELWEAANAALRERNSRGRPPKHGKALLSGFLRCVVCRCRLTHEVCPRVNSLHRYYSCRTARKLRKCPPCGAPMWRAGELEERVWAELLRVIRDPARIRAALSFEEEPPKAPDRKRIERELRALTGAEARIDAAYRRGVLTLERYEGQLGALEEERAALLRTLAEGEARLSAWRERRREADRWVRHYEERGALLEGATGEERRERLEEAVREVLITPGGDVEIVLRF
jgi:site-specific DNA recombinase